MKNRRIKEELKHIYQPAIPQKKDEFLRTIENNLLADADWQSTMQDRMQGMMQDRMQGTMQNTMQNTYGQNSCSKAFKQISMQDFLIMQLHYIPSWVWGISVLVFAIAFYIMRNLGTEAAWIISALLPFVAVSAVTALHRSIYYEMDELEQATRFSLKAVVYARLCIVGISNVLLMLILSPIMVEMCQISLLEVIACLLCPYTMTAFCCLYVLRMWHSEENIFACAGISMAVSLLCFFQEKFQLIAVSASMYLLIACMLSVLTLVECKRYFIYMEEWRWS